MGSELDELGPRDSLCGNSPFFGPSDGFSITKFWFARRSKTLLKSCDGFNGQKAHNFGLGNLLTPALQPGRRGWGQLGSSCTSQQLTKLAVQTFRLKLDHLFRDPHRSPNKSDRRPDPFHQTHELFHFFRSTFASDHATSQANVLLGLAESSRLRPSAEVLSVQYERYRAHYGSPIAANMNVKLASETLDHPWILRCVTTWTRRKVEPDRFSL